MIEDIKKPGRPREVSEKEEKMQLKKFRPIQNIV